MERLERADAFLREGSRIRLGVLAVEHQHRQAFAILEVILNKGAKAEGSRPMRRDLHPLAYCDQLKECARKLDKPIFRTPRMPVARTDLKAKALVEARSL